MKVTNLNFGYDKNEILNNINFHLSSGDKVGLVGVNGSGKSTLLKVLSGNLILDSGNINLENETISYLKQEISHKYFDFSIKDYIKNQTGIQKLENKISKLETNLNENNMEEYGEILNEFLAKDGYSFDDNLKEIMYGLKLNKNLDSKISVLSGGEKIKVLLCSLLLSNSDILLLDEPTNNLDMEAIIWLEKYLKNIKKSIIVISHDETFLNNIANKIYEISNGNINEYNLKYNDYIRQKETEYEQNKMKYSNAIQQRKKVEERIQKAKIWSNKGNSSKAHNDNDKIANNFAKERTKSNEVSKLSKSLEKIDIPEFEEKYKINFFLDLDDKKGNKNIFVDELVCGFEDFKTIPINLNIEFGNKIAINGYNGSGKTTFIKTLIGLIKPISGNIKFGSNVKIGYISQDTIINDNNIGIYDYITNNLESVDSSLVFTLLNNFGISYDDRDKKYTDLSPGQRTRVNLVKMALNKINVLVLDEVTNHLDKDALDLIYELIQTYPGTIISISHNRKYNEILNPDFTFDISTGNIDYLKNNYKKLRK